MGFVRTVRSGGLHQCSKAICFIPDLEDMESFEELGKTESVATNFSAAKDLDEVVTLLTKNLSDGTEFFKVRFFIMLSPDLPNFSQYIFNEKKFSKTKNFSNFLELNFFPSSLLFSLIFQEKMQVIVLVFQTFILFLVAGGSFFGRIPARQKSASSKLLRYRSTTGRCFSPETIIPHLLWNFWLNVKCFQFVDGQLCGSRCDVQGATA